MEVSKEISFSVKADSVGDAYEKLAKQTTWGNAEENSLAILALRNFDSALARQGADNLISNSQNGECWPKDGCEVKETALVLMALYETNKTLEAEKARSWLLDAQNSLAIGTWSLSLRTSSLGNSACTLIINNNTQVLEMQQGVLEKALTLPEENVNLKVYCDVNGTTNADIIHTYLGKVNVFSTTKSSESFIEGNLTKVHDTHSITLGNEKCWGSDYRDKCTIEDTYFALLALEKLGIKDEVAVNWLEKNRQDTVTISQISLLYFKVDAQSLNWLINNQALEGYWNNRSLSVSNKEDAFVTALALNALKTQNALVEIRGREYLLGKLNSLRGKELSAALYFVFPSSEIKNIISIDPAIIKIKEGGNFSIIIENRGDKASSISVTNLNSKENYEVRKDEFKKLNFVAGKSTYFLVVDYVNGIYNIPVIITEIKQGQEVAIIEENVSVIPTLAFEAEINETILQNESATFKIKLKNPYSVPIENVFLVLTADLYKIVRTEPVFIESIKPNEEVEIALVVNEASYANFGIYEGKLKATDGLEVTTPVRIEIKAVEGITPPSSTNVTVNTTELEEKEQKKAQKKIGTVMLVIAAIIILLVILYLVWRGKKGRRKKEVGIEKVLEKIEEKESGKFVEKGKF